jgi:uncharacterized protein (DUF2236 family)
MTEGLPLPAGSISRRFNLEPVLFAGGARAVLLQVAHPSVAAGVAAFSDYRRDPWNRLFRTVDVMLKLTFGTPEQSARQERILAARHRRVTGVDDLGNHYHALDPELLLWVWATLVDTAADVYQRVFGRLTDGDLERYHAEQIPVAVACGAPRDVVPDTWADLRAYFQRMVDEELVITDSARDVLVATEVPPLPTPLRQVLGPFNSAVTTALLPPRIREAYGLEWNGRVAARAELFFAGARAGRVVPPTIRRMPSRMQLNRERPLHLRPVLGAGMGARILARRSSPVATR